MTDQQRRLDREIETEAGWPSGREMVGQLLAALGRPDVAMPVPPRQVWEDALREVERMRRALPPGRR